MRNLKAHTFRNGFYAALGGMFFPLVSFAEDAAHAASSGGGSFIGLAAGLGMGIAVLGAALGQGKIAAAFMEGASRNPGAVDSMKTQLILSLVFVETLVLFTVLISYLLIGKL
jgi:F-type H+-transporting ATPase subunit c